MSGRLLGVSVLVGACALSTAGCASKRVASPPPAPRAERPVDAIPADLDLVVRIDLSRIRAVLGEAAMNELLQKARPANDPDSDLGTQNAVNDALGRADTAWLAVRPGLSPELSDNVLVLRGRFQGIEVRRAGSEPNWELPRDLGATWRRYDRKKPKRRAAPARVYTHADSLMVFVSEAEIDSVERALEQGRGDPPLEPPEKGAVALAARLAPLLPKLRQRAPTISRLFDGARRAEASADIGSEGLDAELGIEFQDPEQATRVGDAVRQIVSIGRHAKGRLASISRGLTVTNSGEFVTARLKLVSSDLAELLECGRTGCAW